MASSSQPPSLKAIDLVRNGHLPENWAYVPVAGKATYIAGWTTRPLTWDQVEIAYKTNPAYKGLGVVTGSFSEGLIALDVDGEEADARLKAALGDDYEPLGEESTMSWTSGKPGRRQVLYQVPEYLAKSLTKVKKIALGVDGEWMTESEAGGEGKPAEEVVLRYQGCMSVIPGSPHPEGKTYHFLNYNGGKVADAPGWLLDVLVCHCKPMAFLTDKEIDKLSAEFDTSRTLLPVRQIRGWFFKDEVQSKLMPRLEELVFNDLVFDKYGWKYRNGAKPQAMSGCPWHGGESGTSFSYARETGCWLCRSCGVGGDLLDYMHKIRSRDAYASAPRGATLESYVSELAAELGYTYPDDALPVSTHRTIDTPRLTLTGAEFYEALHAIYKEERNPALRSDRMWQLATDSGRFRMSGKDCEAALLEYLYNKSQDGGAVQPGFFSQLEESKFLVPDLLPTPSQVILHAAGGVGKTSACLGLASAVLRGSPVRVRGLDREVKPGNVLWIQSDQNPIKLKQDLEDHGIDPDGRDAGKFVYVRQFQLNRVDVMADLVRQYRPALVVVDSIGSVSSRMQVSEIEKAFAMPLYMYSELNGDPEQEMGFPATTIIWIHHDNAQGDVRGTKYLINAIDEQWHLRELKDDEKDRAREMGEVPASLRIIEVRKSRTGRQGTALRVRRDDDFRYELEDATPLMRREDAGQGDPEPFSMVLQLVEEICGAQDAGERAKVGQGGATAEEVWRELVERMAAFSYRRKAPSMSTVKRWLKRWVGRALLVEGLREQESSSGGRPSVVYRSARACALSSSESFFDRNPTRTTAAQGERFRSPDDQNLEMTETPEGGNEQGRFRSNQVSVKPMTETTSTAAQGSSGGFGQKSTEGQTNKGADESSESQGWERFGIPGAPDDLTQEEWDEIERLVDESGQPDPN